MESTTGNLLLVYGGILLSHGVINHFGIRLVARLNDLSVTVHIVGVLVIVAALLIFAPRQPAGFFLARVTQHRRAGPTDGRLWWGYCRRCGPLRG
jgi:amino acid transporter